MVPMLTCGLLRSNFAFATAVLLRTLLMRHATSGTDCGRQGVGGWIWTWTAFDPGPVTVWQRPHHPDCGGYGWPRKGANPYRSVFHYFFDIELFGSIHGRRRTTPPRHR